MHHEVLESTQASMRFVVDNDFSLLSLAHSIVVSGLFSVAEIGELGDYLQTYALHHALED